MREKLIELVVDACEEAANICAGADCNECVGKNNNCLNFLIGNTIADALIANGVTIQRWIPVTERLPEYDVKVLVCNSENGDLHTATLDNEIWHLDGGWLLDVDDFTHWMPLPDAPKDGE